VRGVLGCFQDQNGLSKKILTLKLNQNVSPKTQILPIKKSFKGLWKPSRGISEFGKYYSKFINLEIHKDSLSMLNDMNRTSI